MFKLKVVRFYWRNEGGSLLDPSGKGSGSHVLRVEQTLPGENDIQAGPSLMEN